MHVELYLQMVTVGGAVILEIITRHDPDQTEITVLRLNPVGPANRMETMGWGYILDQEELDIVARYLRERWGG